MRAILGLLTILAAGGQGAYVPGTPGGAWTPEQIDVTRQRIHAMIDPRKKQQIDLYGKGEAIGDNPPLSENTLLRLAFHDCLRYTDGTGGCDGCLNWADMGFKYGNFPGASVPTHYYKPMLKTNNNNFARQVKYLEMIYTTTDWPASAPGLAVSLKEAGISRADLWSFAGLVALERTIERSNWACDYDFNGRQQVTLLEGRDKCDIKLTQPVKFRYGRADCIPEDEEIPYKTSKEEAHPTFNDAIQVVDLMKSDFNMTARQFIALTGIHGAASRVAENTIGTKYTWFGMAYLSNMYYKEIANRPTYKNDRGGDPTFVDANQVGWTYFTNSYGDKNAQPIASRNWRLSCMDLWDTEDRGPCFFRPTNLNQPANPAYAEHGIKVLMPCGNGVDAKGNTIVDTSAKCRGAEFDENGIEIAGREQRPFATRGWANQFGLPYELGLYYDFEVSGPANRPRGCPGIDVETVDFPFEDVHKGTTSKHSNPIQCNKTTYAPEGEVMSSIVEEFADDHDLWAAEFLEAWQVMQNNVDQELHPASQESWLGYHSLEKANVDVGGDYEAYIAANSPLVFTSPDAPDIFLCGNTGGPINKCGHYVTEYMDNWRKYVPPTKK